MIALMKKLLFVVIEQRAFTIAKGAVRCHWRPLNYLLRCVFLGLVNALKF